MPGASELRRRLYEQLLIWLERQNNSDRTPFLDRPIVLTLLGGVVAGLLTAYWQSSEKTRELEMAHRTQVTTEETAVLKEFATTYASTGSTANTWFTKLIWLADETNKPQTADTKRHIDAWRQQTQALEERYSKAKPLDAVLPLIGVLYNCPSVHQAAEKMTNAWDTYVGTFQKFNQEWNDLLKLDDARIRVADADRKRLLQSMENMSERLIEKMADELRKAPDAACP